MLSWDQVRLMARNRVEFGAHSVTHPILTQVEEKEAMKKSSDQKTKSRPNWISPSFILRIPTDNPKISRLPLSKCE